MRRQSDYAKQIYLSNQPTWDSLQPILNVKYEPDESLKKKEKRQVKPEPKEKLEKKRKKPKAKFHHEEIKNTRFSLTSFVIPLYITGQKKDYQLLYCICALKNGMKVMSTTLRKEGFAQLYMIGMKSEMDWVKVKESNVTFTDIIIEFLIKSGTVCMVAANKKETIKKVFNTNAPFVVLLATTDIPMPCQANLCVGTSWMIFRRSEESRKCLFDREVYNCGRRAVHTGIMITGCSTILSCAFKKVDGVHHFIFDTSTGDFRLYDNGCFIRRSGNLLSVNEALFYKFTPKLQEWLYQKKDKKEEKQYCSRYTGGWVTDGYKVLRSGGLLLSPKDSVNNEGRIKYLYTAVPLAYMAEKAGGKALSGRKSILKMTPTRTGNTSLVLGSIEEVDGYINKVLELQPSYGIVDKDDTDSDDTSTDLGE